MTNITPLNQRIIRVSERGTFKRCRKRWDYSSPARQNLTAVGSPIALSFGSMIHKTLELWAESEAADKVIPMSPIEIFTQTAYEELDAMKARYKAAIGADPSEAELDVFYDHVELGRDMISNYEARWGSPVPEGYSMVQAEQMFLIEVPGTDAVLQGTLDGLMVSDAGDFYVLERKTYANRPRIDSLNSNDQFLAYIWAVGKLLGNPAQVGGIFYDGLWKRKLDKRHPMEGLFMRELLLRPPEELAQFETYLTDEVKDMTDPNVRIYLNRRWEGCFDCPFERLCLAESRGEDADYVRHSAYVEVQHTSPEEDDDNDFSSTTG